MDTHILPTKWILWFHNPLDNDWTLNSYTKIDEITSIESFWELYLRLNKSILQDGMLFLMKDGVEPLWETEANRNGGCWSYKVNKSDVYSSWLNLSITLCCQTLLTETSKFKYINGISISPKKLFCIIKIWNNTSNLKEVNILNINNYDKMKCIYKAHNDR